MAQTVPRRRATWEWVLGAFVILSFLVVLGLAIAQTVQATPPEDRDLDPTDLSAVLDYANLPRTFTYGGTTWQAADSGRFRERMQLVEITPGGRVDGRPLYRRADRPATDLQSVFVPAATAGPHRDIFVRYERL